MKKQLAILLLCLYSFSTTELHQLLKVPFMVEHYLEHKEQNQHLTLMQFLKLHYNSGNTRDRDYEKDQKLPFKSHDCCSSNFCIAYLPQENIQPNFAQHKLIFFEGNSFDLNDESFLGSSILDNIWQPPRFS